MLEKTRNSGEAGLGPEGDHQLVIVDRQRFPPDQRHANLLRRGIEGGQLTVDHLRSRTETPDRVDDTSGLNCAADNLGEQRLKEKITLTGEESDLDVREFSEQALEPHRAVDASNPAAQDDDLPRLILGDGAPPAPVPVGNEGDQETVEDDVPEHTLAQDCAEEDEGCQEYDRQGTHQHAGHDEGT